jgi:endonuclease/exonuclease/phosphatase family metal-dependent hydrolase
MKLITLNIWGGKVFQPLVEFLERNKDVDIFCFQEVYHSETDKTEFHHIRPNIYSEIKQVLTDFNSFYAPAQEGSYNEIQTDFSISFGLAMFVKKTIQIDAHEDVFVFRSKNSKQPGEDSAGIGRNLEHVTFKKNDNTYSVFNLHGLWNGKGKSDTEDRLNQSKRTKEFMSHFKNNKTILCGDFNLMPDTESLAILESGMKNLVKEYGVISTRSSLYTKPLKFADYILTSSNVTVKDFKVLQDEVSDHLPLYIEFE